MADQSYLSVWCKEFPEEVMIERFGEFLATVPYSAMKPGLSYLTIRAVDSSETPVLEHDLRALPMDPAGILELSKDHLHTDCSYEARAHWDLWVFDASGETGFRSDAHALDLTCYGENYDDEVWREYGHFSANLGFDDLFTGYAGLLDVGGSVERAAETPQEARFLEAMAWPENMERYREKTRQNIGRLMDWVARIQKAIPGGRMRLWSEGDDNFETRLREIMATHP